LLTRVEYVVVAVLGVRVVPFVVPLDRHPRHATGERLDLVTEHIPLAPESPAKPNVIKCLTKLKGGIMNVSPSWSELESWWGLCPSTAECRAGA
jgi:hypothetical protein